MSHYFIGINGLDVATSNKEIAKLLAVQIGSHWQRGEVLQYFGGYRSAESQNVFEQVLVIPSETVILCTELFNKEESIYEATIISRIKIGNLTERDYLIITICDLMDSLTLPKSGFTIEINYASKEVNLLLCKEGVYHMNPNYNKENQDATK